MPQQWSGVDEHHQPPLPFGALLIADLLPWSSRFLRERVPLFVSRSPSDCLTPRCCPASSPPIPWRSRLRVAKRLVDPDQDHPHVAQGSASLFTSGWFSCSENPIIVYEPGMDTITCIDYPLNGKENYRQQPRLSTRASIFSYKEFPSEAPICGELCLLHACSKKTLSCCETPGLPRIRHAFCARPSLGSFVVKR